MSAMRCADVEKFVHPYLDGEFAAEDRQLLEEHLAGCEACRAAVAGHRALQVTLRTRLGRPRAPEGLEARVRAALDRADARGQGPAPRVPARVVAWTAGGLCAAAALVLVVGALRQSPVGSPLVEDAIRSHEKNLPVEVAGGEDRVRSWMSGKVPVPVRPPRMRQPGASLVGGRLGHLRDRDAAQLLYQVDGSPVTVHVFDASGLRMAQPGSQLVNGQDGRRLYLVRKRGYNVVTFRDHDVGYAFTSDLSPDQMIRLVQASLSE